MRRPGASLSGFAAAFVFLAGAVLLLTACNRRQQAAVSAASKDAPPEELSSAPELQLDYSILLEDGGRERRIGEKFHFHSGDRFRIALRPAFAAHVYLLNRGPLKNEYTFLYPEPKEFGNPLTPNRAITLPSSTEWYQLDGKPGVENVVLIASASPVVEFNTPERSIARDEFDDRIALVERDDRPSSSRRYEDGDWVKMFAASGDKTVMVLRLPLDHR
jgi:Domain of unknown function (DUF4384)